MVKTSIAFFAGAVVIATAAFSAAGAPARLGALITGIILTGALLSFPRTAARVLLAAADAMDSFREAYQDDRRPARVKPAPSETAVQSDVIAALVTQGMRRKEARARVLAAGPCDDFEQLFRKAVTA